MPQLRVPVSFGGLFRLRQFRRSERVCGALHEEDKMPYITISLREGKTLEQKREMVKAVTDAITRSLGVKPEAVSIVLHDLPATNFAREGILLSDRT